MQFYEQLATLGMEFWNKQIYLRCI